MRKTGLKLPISGFSSKEAEEIAKAVDRELQEDCDDPFFAAVNRRVDEEYDFSVKIPKENDSEKRNNGQKADNKVFKGYKVGNFITTDITECKMYAKFQAANGITPKIETVVSINDKEYSVDITDLMLTPTAPAPDPQSSPTGIVFYAQATEAQIISELLPESARKDIYVDRDSYGDESEVYLLHEIINGRPKRVSLEEALRAEEERSGRDFAYIRIYRGWNPKTGDPNSVVMDRDWQENALSFKEVSTQRNWYVPISDTLKKD